MRRAAFTLIELLVVIAIVGVLVAMLLPAVQAAREAARRAQCTNNLRQVGLALHNFHQARKCFPAGYVSTAVYKDGATDTSPGWGWATHILPFLEEQPLYSSINLRLPIQNAANAKAIQSQIPVYLCPSDLTPDAAFQVADNSGNSLATAAAASYAACVGGDESGASDLRGLGIFFRNSRTRIGEIKDGTSKTLMVGERAWSNAQGIWAGAIDKGVCLRGLQNPCPKTGANSYPAPTLILAHSHLNNATVDPDGGIDDFSSPHAGGSNFVMADGSVHFIVSVTGDDPSGAYTAEGIVLQALGTKSSGEFIPEGWLE